MNYKIKRNIARLNKYFIAKELGIKLNEYEEMEKGQRRMGDNELEKFQKITTVSKKEYKTKQEIECGTAINWLKQNDIKAKCSEFNITIVTLAKDIGCKKGSIYEITAGRKFNKDIALAIYDYFQNNGNKRMEKIITRNIKGKRESFVTKNINNPTGYDFELIKNTLNLTSYYKIEEKLGLSRGNVSHWLNGKHRISDKHKNKLDELLKEKGSSLEKMEFINKNKEEKIVETIKENEKTEIIKETTMPINKELVKTAIKDIEMLQNENELLKEVLNSMNILIKLINKGENK